MRKVTKLEVLRRAAGMTLRDVGRRLRVSPESVRQWEKGDLDIPEKKRPVLARVYGVHPRELVAIPLDSVQ